MACPSGNGGSVVNDPKTLMFNNYMKDCNKTMQTCLKVIHMARLNVVK